MLDCRDQIVLMSDAVTAAAAAISTDPAHCVATAHRVTTAGHTASAASAHGTRRWRPHCLCLVVVGHGLRVILYARLKLVH